MFRDVLGDTNFLSGRAVDVAEDPDCCATPGTDDALSPDDPSF